MKFDALPMAPEAEIPEDILYAMSRMEGVEPDWRAEYRRAYERCKAQQEEIERLIAARDQAASLIESAVLEVVEYTGDSVSADTWCFANEDGHRTWQYRIWVTAVSASTAEVRTLDEAVRLAKALYDAARMPQATELQTAQ